MKLFTFYLINFFVAFFSDIILNDLSKRHFSEIIRSLRPYFREHSILIAGLYAAITVLLCILVVSLILYKLLNVTHPTNLKEIFYFAILSFCVGFIADILIDKLNIFGSTLKSYYLIAGAGKWGGLAIMFSVVLSYIIQKYLLPIL